MRTNLLPNKHSVVKEKTDSTSDSALDMVIAFDTTGSMYKYIDAVKRHCVELVPKLLSANPDMRIGVVAFGDYCDMVNKNTFGPAYQVLSLTNCKDDIIKFINEAKRTCGGDAAEFYELVIKKITEETDWRDNAAKAVLLIADEIPHEIGYNYLPIVKNNQIDWRKEAKKAADKGIKFDTLSIYDKPWYKELSKITGGVNAPFKTSSNTSQVIEASVYSKVKATKEVFKATMDSVMASDNSEMKAVYSVFSKEIL